MSSTMMPSMSEDTGEDRAADGMAVDQDQSLLYSALKPRAAIAQRDSFIRATCIPGTICSASGKV